MEDKKYEGYREKTPEDEQGIHPHPAPTKHPPYPLQLEDEPEIQPQHLQDQEESLTDPQEPEQSSENQHQPQIQTAKESRQQRPEDKQVTQPWPAPVKHPPWLKEDEQETEP